MTETNKQQNAAEQGPENSTSELSGNEEENTSLNVMPLETRDIDDPEARFVYIDPDTAIAVDRTTGQILGQSGEGTLGIVFYGGEAKEIKGKRFEVERAIRIPRLLQGDVLLNFHVAEIVYHESRQAAKFDGIPTLLGAGGFYRLDNAYPYTKIPDEEDLAATISDEANTSEAAPDKTGDSSPLSEIAKEHFYIGFYLSPTSQYQLCLVSMQRAWPKNFSNYLESIDFNSQQLFNEISSKCESARINVFSKLLFLPDNIEPRKDTTKSKPSSQESNRRDVEQRKDSTKNNSYLQELNRESLDRDYAAKREVGGWWFNLPVAVYPWMTANLERLLTAYVDDDAGDDDNGNRIPSLKKWKLKQWFQLINQLALGFNELHQKGAIHGDPRPANIMTNIHNEPNLRPGNFRWIDIGLGYGANDVIRDGNPPPIDEDSVISPRPLGGGRATIFYAPEREEALEFEDADMVHLEQSKSNTNFSELRFFWRERSHLRPTELQLKNGDTPLRELGRLKRGDRVQVREFLLDIERVEEKSIIVSDIYEILLDRVLVEKKQDRNLIHDRLKGAAISRYRIFKQWSQATDIYSLGIMSMYLFFLRGMHKMRTFSGLPSNEASDNLLSRDPILDQTNREKTFGELVSLMRNRSFLGNMLSVFKKELKDSGLPWGQTTSKPESEANPKVDENFELEAKVEAEENESSDRPLAEKISQEILIRDANFIFIWRGLDGNNLLFIWLIYFCFCCLWRQEEIVEILDEKKVVFEPFCANRLMIEDDEKQADPSEEDKEKQADPSEKALAALEFLQDISATSPAYDSNLPDVVDPETILRSRENQWISLTNNLTQIREENKLLEQSILQLTEQANALKEDLVKAKSSGIESLESVEKLFDEIQATLSTVDEQFEKGVVTIIKNKDSIKESIKSVSKLAKKGKGLSDKTR